jgi:hypothetical protein
MPDGDGLDGLSTGGFGKKVGVVVYGGVLTLYACSVDASLMSFIA